MQKGPLGFVLPLFSSLVLAGFFLLAFRFPSASGLGYLEAIMAFLLPVLLLETLFRGRALGWAFVSLFTGMAGLLYWVPRLIHTKGPLSWAIAIPGAMALWAWEVAGLVLVLWIIRLAYRRVGKSAAALTAALGIAIWEAFGYHVYPWAWGSALGSVPWMARAAAFLSTYGLSALIWGCAAWAAGHLADDLDRKARFKALIPAGVLYGSLLVLGLGWFALPKGPEHRLDVAVVQPNYPPGTRRPGMMEDMWARTDALLQEKKLPKQGVTTLLLWPESSVMGYNMSGPLPYLQGEAARRGVVWLFGTEGPRLNLVRGEAVGRPAFIQAKVTPMPFGERMPGPTPVREWLDANLGFHSEVPGELSPASSFSVSTPQGDLKVHPLICSEALIPSRVLQGLSMAGGELLANLTNDGWFEDSIATDLHASQIRFRAVETGLPMVRATLTGKSGLFHANGRWELWGEPMTEGAKAFELTWRPVQTPARWRGLLPMVLGLLVLALGAILWRSRKVTP